MGKRLLALNTVMAIAAVLLAMYIVRELVRGYAAPVVRNPAGGASRPTVAMPPPPPGGPYAVIASRNLFSPTRSEAPAAATGAPVIQFAKPNLYGVVLRDGAPIAYLEDPVTRRVSGYRLGDEVAGGKLTKIAGDHVILARPEGAVDIRLHDPSRPRPAVPPAPGQPQLTPGAPLPAQGVPGLIPPAQPQEPPGQAVQPTPAPFRRPLPPVLRRQPEGPGVPAQQ